MNTFEEVKEYQYDSCPMKSYRLDTKELMMILKKVLPEKSTIDYLKLFSLLEKYHNGPTYVNPLLDSKKSKSLIKSSEKKIKALFSRGSKYRYFDIHIKPSTIEGAGMGAFAMESIPEGWKVQYVGEIKDGDCGNEYYSWQIFPYNESGIPLRNLPVEDVLDININLSSEKTDSEDSSSLLSESSVETVYTDSEEMDPESCLFLIDSTKISKSNWTRFVNCGIPVDKNNMEAEQKFDNIFYTTLRNISEGEELFVDYGEDYRRENLGEK